MPIITIMRRPYLVLLTLILSGLYPVLSNCQSQNGSWEQIFNGKDLDDWTIKVRGFEPGENYKNTFRVEDGMMKVSYDEYEEYNDRFAHIFYNEKLTNYRIRVEYRFVGEQAKNAPGWALLNSGIMLHCESPHDMDIDQGFPTSIEAQMLGRPNADPRPCGSVCTPGTHIFIKNELVKDHCISSSSEGVDKDEWVTMEVEVNNGQFKHWVNGELVMEYSDPILDDTDEYASKLLNDGAPRELTSGYISLQGESHGMEVRKVELLRIE